MSKVKHPFWKYILNILILFSFVLYAYGVYYCTLGGYRVVMNADGLIFRNVNLTPFAMIKLYWEGYKSGSVSYQVSVMNLVGNVLLMLPMAMYLPYFFKGQRKLIITLLTVFLLVVGIEITQFVTGRGSCDVDDVILNMAGALFGYLIYKLPSMQRLRMSITIFGK